MADYIPITSGQTDPGAPITAQLMKALEENPRAIAEGAAGAPRIAAIAAMSHLGNAGLVGTYVFARRLSAGNIGFGGGVGGSDLAPTSATWGIDDPGASVTTNFPNGSALSGTWRCMGSYTHQVTPGTGFNLRGATLWLRIA